MHRRTPGRRFSPRSFPLRAILLTLLAGIGLGLIALFSGDNADARAKIGKLPKDSLARHQLRTLDGRQFTLADLRGQVVVLDFFAVWCGHSKRHVPTLARFGEAESRQGLQIIGLAVQDSESTPDRVAQFMKEYQITYPVGMVKDPVFADFVDSNDVSVPQTLVYGRDGRLVAHFSGHDPNVDAELTSTIKRELEK